MRPLWWWRERFLAGLFFGLFERQVAGALSREGHFSGHPARARASSERGSSRG